MLTTGSLNLYILFLAKIWHTHPSHYTQTFDIVAGHCWALRLLQKLPTRLGSPVLVAEIDPYFIFLVHKILAQNPPWQFSPNMRGQTLWQKNIMSHPSVMLTGYCFSFVEETLDTPADLTSVKERSELLKCKCVSLAHIIPLCSLNQIQMNF